MTLLGRTNRSLVLLVGGVTAAVVVATVVVAARGTTSSGAGAGNDEETITAGTCSVTFMPAKNKRSEVERFLRTLPSEFCQDAPWPLYFMADDELVAVTIALKPGGTDGAKGFLVMTASEMAKVFQRRACWLIRNPEGGLGDIVDRVCILPPQREAFDGAVGPAPACGAELDSSLSSAAEKATDAIAHLAEAKRADNATSRAVALEAASSSLDSVAVQLSWAQSSANAMRAAAGRLRTAARDLRAGRVPDELQDVASRIRAATLDVTNSDVVKRCKGANP